MARWGGGAPPLQVPMRPETSGPAHRPAPAAAAMLRRGEACPGWRGQRGERPTCVTLMVPTPSTSRTGALMEPLNEGAIAGGLNALAARQDALPGRGLRWRSPFAARTRAPTARSSSWRCSGLCAGRRRSKRLDLPAQHRICTRSSKCFCRRYGSSWLPTQSRSASRITLHRAPFQKPPPTAPAAPLRCQSTRRLRGADSPAFRLRPGKEAPAAACARPERRCAATATQPAVERATAWPVASARPGRRSIVSGGAPCSSALV